MATVTRAQIQALLETGDKPTQAEFVSIFLGVPNIQDDGILPGAEDAITAHASGLIGNAYVMTKKVNKIDVAGAPNSSVKFLPSIPGMSAVVWNNAINDIRVFANDGGQINVGGVDTALVMLGGLKTEFYCYATDLWMALI